MTAPISPFQKSTNLAFRLRLRTAASSSHSQSELLSPSTLCEIIFITSPIDRENRSFMQCYAPQRDSHLGRKPEAGGDNTPQSIHLSRLHCARLFQSPLLQLCTEGERKSVKVEGGAGSLPLARRSGGPRPGTPRRSFCRILSSYPTILTPKVRLWLQPPSLLDRSQRGREEEFEQRPLAGPTA